jgi:hypothetical protein
MKDMRPCRRQFLKSGLVGLGYAALPSDEGEDDDTGLIVRIARRVARAILNDRIARPKLAGCAVIKLEYATPGNDELIIDCRGRMHSRMVWFEGVSETRKFLIQFADGCSHVKTFGH